ncbi:MAG: signal peptidase I [Anaerolineae bacterium]|nr:signal peptidase I [Anaerolineae bacterium]MDK1080709.1 signal peptidase I [Anaerolineae bacterium]
MNFVNTENEDEALGSSEPSEESKSIKQFLVDLLETVVLAAILFIVINTVSARVKVDGTSMIPTLSDNEYVLVNRLAYRNKAPDRGDIIVFESPQSSQFDLIKRVIGLPGNVVKVIDGVVQIDGETLKEPYIAAAPTYNGEWIVPAGHLYVLGDNRNDSSDSHTWGLLPVENVIGKAILIYWPLPDWTLINHVESVSAFR